MALQTEVVSLIRDTSGEARLEFDYDDAQGPSEIPIFDEVRVVNTLNRAVLTTLRRSANQQVWQTQTVLSGEVWTRTITGGPVRSEADLVNFNLRTV